MSEASFLANAVVARDSVRDDLAAAEARSLCEAELIEKVRLVGVVWLNGFAVACEKLIQSARCEDWADVEPLLVEARAAMYEYDVKKSVATHGQGLEKVQELRGVAIAFQELEEVLWENPRTS